MFAAAASVGLASKPILLFYGLSQAGRAVAAASQDAKRNDEWRLRGHGIELTNLHDRPAPALPDVRIRDKPNGGSFTQLASILRSGTLPQETQLVRVWNMLPDVVFGVGRLEAEQDFGPLQVKGRTIAKRGVVTTYVHRLPHRLRDASEEDIVDYLVSYPSLASSGPPTTDFAPQVIERDGASPQEVVIARSWPFSGERADVQAFQLSLMQPYRGDNERYAFPALGGSNAPLSPFLAWWALLFTLSMLARYEPEAWTRDTNVEVSPLAVILEAVLDHAPDRSRAGLARDTRSKRVA